MDDDNNEELDQMEADRQNRLAEKSGKEILKKQGKKDKRKQILQAIIKAIVAHAQLILAIILVSSIFVVIAISIFTIILGGDSKQNEVTQEDMTTTSSSMDLQAYLQQFSHTGEAPQSDDGKFYKMYGDGAGWPTIGNADLQWKSNESKFACSGKVLSSNGEQTVSNVQEYVNNFLTRGSSATYTDEEIDAMGIYIDKELVDSIGATVAETHYQTVEGITKDLNLSKQQLYALTAIEYNFGCLPERNGHTFLEVYEEASSKYPVNSWQHMRYIWDNWWNALGGGYAGHIPARDAAFETFVKGVFDFSQSAAGEVFSRNYYIYYTQEQLNQYSYAPDKPITREPENEQHEKEIFTYVGAVETKFDGETVSAAGYVFPHYLQKNFSGRYGTSTIAASGCGPTSMAMILAGLCNDTSITPVTFIENLEEYYNGDWSPYYAPGTGSLYAGLCNSDFLEKYYHCKSTVVQSTSQAWSAIASRKCVIGSEKGHVLAIIPLPNEYRTGEYKFYILDSARGHSGAFKSEQDFINRTGASFLKTWYIIEPLN